MCLCMYIIMYVIVMQTTLPLMEQLHICTSRGFVPESGPWAFIFLTNLYIGSTSIKSKTLNQSWFNAVTALQIQKTLYGGIHL